MNYLDYDNDEVRAVALIEAVRDDLEPDELRTSRSLVANGEWELGLDVALRACLERSRFTDLDATAALLCAVRKTEKTPGGYDRMLLSLLQNARTGETG